MTLSRSRQNLLALVAALVGAALAATGIAVVVSRPATAINTSGLTPFPAGDGSTTVWQALSDTGSSTTTINLISSTDGSVVETLGSYNEPINALSYYDDAGVLTALVDAQFVNSIPLNNAPSLVVIDSTGAVTVDSTVPAPNLNGFGGTTLSYAAGSGADGTYWVPGFTYTVSQLTLLQRIQTGTLQGDEIAMTLGKVDLSTDPTTAVQWGDLDLSSPLCAAQAQAYFAEILAQQSPTSYFADLVVDSNGTIVTVMTGNATTGDVYMTIDPTTLVATCTAIPSGDIPGLTGGLAYDANGDLIGMSLEDGSFWKITPTGSTQIAAGTGSNLRGDLASNPSGSAVTQPTPTPEPTATPTLEPTATPTLAPTATSEPTATPTLEPTATSEPTAVATVDPLDPTAVPTATSEPTMVPTTAPTATSEPTAVATVDPLDPTAVPTATTEPTAVATVDPLDPTAVPTATATGAPTATTDPTATATASPIVTAQPTATMTAQSTTTPAPTTVVVLPTKTPPAKATATTSPTKPSTPAKPQPTAPKPPLAYTGSNTLNLALASLLMILGGLFLTFAARSFGRN